MLPPSNPLSYGFCRYLRVVLANMNRLDLAELSGREDVTALASALDVELS